MLKPFVHSKTRFLLFGSLAKDTSLLDGHHRKPLGNRRRLAGHGIPWRRGRRSAPPPRTGRAPRARTGQTAGRGEGEQRHDGVATEQSPARRITSPKAQIRARLTRSLGSTVPESRARRARRTASNKHARMRAPRRMKMARGTSPLADALGPRRGRSPRRTMLTHRASHAPDDFQTNA